MPLPLGPNQFGDTSSATEGFNSGANWAVQAAHVGIQKQQAETQAGQLKMYRDEFNAKLGSQQMSDLANLATMPNGELKNSLIKAKQSYYQQAGIPIHDTWWSAVKDQNFAPNLAKLIPVNDAFKIADPNGFNQTMATLHGSGVLSNEAQMGLVDKYVSAAGMAAAAATKAKSTVESAGIGADAKKYQADKTAEATSGRIKNTNVRKAQSQYDTQTGPIGAAFENSFKIDSLLKEGLKPDGSIVISPQLLSDINADYTGLITQRKNYAQGSEDQKSFDSLRIRIGKKLQILKDAPEGVLSAENAQQLMGQVKILQNDLVQQHDRTYKKLLGGSDPAQQDTINERAKAFQEQYGASLGGWPGVRVGAQETQDPAKANAGGGANQPGEPGAPTNAPSAPVPSPAPAPKADPAQVRAGAQAKQLYDKQPAGPKKDYMLSKIKSTFSPEILKMIGLQ